MIDGELSPQPFRFKGSVPASKSIYNRSLIVKSFFSDLNLTGFSSCDDVTFLKEALLELEQGKSQFFCGEGGTTFRFLAFRTSREEGSFTLEMDSSLARRPNGAIVEALSQFGVDSILNNDSLVIHSKGWTNPHRPLKIQCSESSQFLSGVLLSAWNLDFPLVIDLNETISSSSYFLMTLDLVKELGMKFYIENSFLHIPAHQKVSHQSYHIESDLSSCFSLAALGALCGKVELVDFPFHSKQPDLQFLEIFKQMKIPWIKKEASLLINKQTELQGINIDLGQCPDLFPVLAALCSFCKTSSKLYGAPQLQKKESNRIKKTSELLTLLGVSHHCLSDGLEIFGNPAIDLKNKIEFDPENDHRMVMAAALFYWKGFNLKILNPQAVNKSYPEYLKIVLSGLSGAH